MQSEIDIVRAFYAAIDAGNMEKASQLLADDFRRYGPPPETMGKRETLEMWSALKTALPDLKHALSNIRAEGRLVLLSAQAGGRHTGPLDLSKMGMSGGVVPHSGRMIIFPPNEFEYTVINGKIVSERDVTPITLFSGAAGFLQAMGVSAS